MMIFYPSLILVTTKIIIKIINFFSFNSTLSAEINNEIFVQRVNSDLVFLAVRCENDVT